MATASEVGKVVRQYWKHSTTGKIWAVELRDGRVQRCCGPFVPGEVGPDRINYLPYRTSGDVQWIEGRRTEFSLHRA